MEFTIKDRKELDGWFKEHYFIDYQEVSKEEFDEKYSNAVATKDFIGSTILEVFN